MADDSITPREAEEELIRRQLVEHFWKFFMAYAPDRGYVYGKHTIDILARLDRAVKDYERGISTNLIFSLPYRHGKSDIISRRFPVWMLGRNPDSEIILACYSDQLASDLSRKARECFRETSWVFGTALSVESSAVNHWEISDHKGSMSATGIGGSIVGRGAGVLLIDDYLKSRQEAESMIIRDRQWDSYNDDLRTRLAPVHINIVCATRWHEDDIVGRLLRRCDPQSKDYDADAPTFEELRYPMQDETTGEWLFLQRFPESWYMHQKSNLGTYGWNSLGQQNPQPRRGNLLRADLVEFLSDDEFDKQTVGARWSRGWDLASKRKERVKSDPDYTVGTLASIHHDVVYIDDVVRGQWNAVARDKIIVDCSLSDGANVPVYIECVAGYTDAYDYITNLLRGRSVVRPYRPRVDKVAHASQFEAKFELGKVRGRAGAWNKAWVQEFNSFPRGDHDDQVDSLGIALSEQVRIGEGLGFST